MSKIFSHRPYRSPGLIDTVFTGRKRPLTLADVVRSSREAKKIQEAVASVRYSAKYAKNHPPTNKHRFTIANKLSKRQCQSLGLDGGYKLTGIGIVPLSLHEAKLLAASRGYTHFRIGQGNNITDLRELAAK